MPKLNVYVSDELLGRMKSAEATDVNWSRVAQAAFEQRLAEISTTSKKTDMEKAIQRLRASRVESQSRSSLRGREAGRSWAMNEADWVQLERVASSDEATGTYPRVDQVPAYGHGYEILCMIDRETYEGSRNDVEEFWLQHADEKYPDEDFVEGFVQGVAAFYDEVVDKI